MIYTVGIESMFPSFTNGCLDDVLEYCLDKQVLGVDTETSGLDWLTKKMLMFQIGDEDRQFVIDTRVIDISPLAEILESEKILKVLHNVSFDDKFCRMLGINMENVWDTMNMNKILTCGHKTERHGLKNVLAKYYPEEAKGIDKDTRNQFINLEGQPFTEKQIVYGADDVRLLPGIQKKQAEEILNQELQMIAALENEAVLAFSEIEYNGIGFNPEPWLKLSTRAKKNAVNVATELDKYVENTPGLSKFIASSFQGDLFMDNSEIRKIDISWNSPKQVLEVFQEAGMSDLEGVGAPELMKYSNNQFVWKYLTYKKQMKLANAYGVDFLKNVKSDGRIHTRFNQILETGRVSSSGPNMQQMPGTNEYRNCFTAGIKDYVYVSSDYSSQELAVIAFGSQDPVWLKALEAKKDLHSVCAELVYGQEWYDAQESDCAYYLNGNQAKCNCKEHKKLRTGVKTINFGLAYGMSEFKLADTLQISVEDAKDLIVAYFSTFPKIKKFLDTLGSYGVKNGHILTYAPYRRKRWFPKWSYNMDFKEKGNIERASKNTPIQGQRKLLSHSA